MRTPIASLLAASLLALAPAGCASGRPSAEEPPPAVSGRVFRVTGFEGDREGLPGRATGGSRAFRVGSGDPVAVAALDESAWPPLAAMLRGPVPVRVWNGNDCDVRVALRQGDAGKDLLIPPGEVAETGLPGGRTSVYVTYAREPGVLYEGRRFLVRGPRTLVEILAPRR